MKAIQITKNGAIFVSDGLLTVRLLQDGECGPSPIAYEVLEWDLRTEPPASWSYLSESELQALPNGGYAKICTAFDEIRETLGSSPRKKGE